MNKLTDAQLAKRKEVLKVMIENKKARCPWMSLKEIAEQLAWDFKSNPSKLQHINALSASMN